MLLKYADYQIKTWISKVIKRIKVDKILVSSFSLVQICWDESEGGKDPLGLAPDQFGHIQMFGRQQRLSGTQDKSKIFRN